MLWLAVVFLIVALVAHFMGSGSTESMALLIAKWCFFAFIILLVINLLLSASGGPSPYWGWPGRY